VKIFKLKNHDKFYWVLINIVNKDFKSADILKTNMAMSKAFRVLEKTGVKSELKSSIILESRQKQESILLEGSSVAILCT
jgi:hypothetical protein